jgi:hypothetical protein
VNIETHKDRVLYHKKADDSVWDRIHLYEDATINDTEEERPVKIWAKKRTQP